jgi:folate-binding Fe-S cluster repair protein YgfZ
MNATYADVRDYAGWLDLSDWGLVRVIGSDRQRFLQAQTTNDLRPLQEGMDSTPPSAPPQGTCSPMLTCWRRKGATYCYCHPPPLVPCWSG